MPSSTKRSISSVLQTEVVKCILFDLHKDKGMSKTKTTE